jgi:hypothetical protein
MKGSNRTAIWRRQCSADEAATDPIVCEGTAVI